MMAYLRDLDLKVVLFALVGCFAVPWLLLGTVSGALSRGGGTWAEQASAVTMALFFLAPPFLAGYFTARYARALPQLHVLLVGVLGLAATFVFLRAPWLMYLGCGVAFIVLLALGAFVKLRGASRNAG